MIPASASRLISLHLAVLALAAAAPCDATAAVTPRVGKLLTCQQMEDNCLKFARRAVMAAGANADLPYNASANACYDSFRQRPEHGGMARKSALQLRVEMHELNSLGRRTHAFGNYCLFLPLCNRKMHYGM